MPGAVPGQSLALVPWDENAPESEVSFDLVACQICGSPYATEPMLWRIESSLPAPMQKDATGLEWVRICPVCRRNVEAERAAKQIVLARSRKNLEKRGRGHRGPLCHCFF